MNLGRRHFQTIKWAQWSLLVIPLVTSPIAGLYVAQYGISFRQVAMVALALVLVILPALANARQLKWYLYVGLSTVGFGLRGLSLGDFEIYPAQVLFWSLSGILLIRPSLRRIRTRWSLAGGWKIFFFLATLAIGTGLYLRTASPGRILRQYFVYLTLVPVLFVIQQLIDSWEDLHRASWILILTAFYVALFALLEYYVPTLFEPFRPCSYYPA